MEGMNPKERKQKERHLKQIYTEMRSAFANEQSRRYASAGGTYGAWQPAGQRGGAAWTQYRSGGDGVGADYASDYIGQGQRLGGYTPFEDTRGSQQPATKRYNQVRPLAGSGLGTRELPPWDKDNVYCFNGRDHWMANFYKDIPVYIDGHSYPTVEHYYQACKLYMLGGAAYSNQIRHLSDPGAAKVAAKKLLLTVSNQAAIDEWRVREGPRLLEYGMMHKFVQNKELRSQLLETGNAILLHSYDKDRVFAAGLNEPELLKWVDKHAGERTLIPDTLNEETVAYFPYQGSGKNLLGLLLMRVRDTIRAARTRIECMEEAAEAAESLADKKVLEANALEDGRDRDPIFAKALASLASKPKTDENLLHKIRQLKIRKDEERAERIKKRAEEKEKVAEAKKEASIEKDEESASGASVSEDAKETKEKKKDKKEKKEKKSKKKDKDEKEEKD